MSDDPVAKFAAQAPPIDTVREEAARCCDETAKLERGERGPLRMPTGPFGIGGEFSDAAFGTAAEVAVAVGNALRAARVGWTPDLPWTMAAKLLRSGWQRGHRLLPHVVGGEPAS